MYIPLRWWHVVYGVKGEVSAALAHTWLADLPMRQRVQEPNPMPTQVR